MNSTQKYAVYNQHNVTSVLTNALRQKHLVDKIVNAKSTLSHVRPKRITHNISKHASPFERKTQHNIDIGNKKLLNSIMKIM